MADDDKIELKEIAIVKRREDKLLNELTLRTESKEILSYYKTTLI